MRELLKPKMVLWKKLIKLTNLRHNWLRKKTQHNILGIEKAAQLKRRQRSKWQWNINNFNVNIFKKLGEIKHFKNLRKLTQNCQEIKIRMVISSSKVPLKENSRTRWFYRKVEQNIQKSVTPNLNFQLAE